LGGGFVGFFFFWGGLGGGGWGGGGVVCGVLGWFGGGVLGWDLILRHLKSVRAGTSCLSNFWCLRTNSICRPVRLPWPLPIGLSVAPPSFSPAFAAFPVRSSPHIARFGFYFLPPLPPHNEHWGSARFFFFSDLRTANVL